MRGAKPIGTCTISHSNAIWLHEIGYCFKIWLILFEENSSVILFTGIKQTMPRSYTHTRTTHLIARLSI